MTTVTYKEVFDNTLAYFDGDELASRVWIDRYALKDISGNYLELTPEDMHRRLAGELARIESKWPQPMAEDAIFSLLDHFKFLIPGGSPMAGIGNMWQTDSLSNCFVIGTNGNADSYGAIMHTDEEQIQLMKRRGGVGHDMSQYRPAGYPVGNSGMQSSGIVPLMERFSRSALEINRHSRGGALMLTLSTRHPEVADFMAAKRTLADLKATNISLRVDNDFMLAVETDGLYSQYFPVDAPNEAIVHQTEAVQLWKDIIKDMWASGEPGLLFWDTIQQNSVADCYANEGFRTISTNPCGEVPLCAYDSCRLLSLNLYSYVVNPFTPHSRFNFDLFRQHAQIAQRLLDDIVELEYEKIQMIIQKIDADPQEESLKYTERCLWEKMARHCTEGRRTGLGVTGEADMLAAMGLHYGSGEATGMAVSVHRALAMAAYRSSVNLAKERGAFLLYDAKKEENNPFINRIREADNSLYEEMKTYGRRNISCLAIAPTGSVSLMSQTSSGIEPVFAMLYRRRRKINSLETVSRNTELPESEQSVEFTHEFHPKLRTWMKNNNMSIPDDASADEIEDMCSHSPYAGATALEIDPIGKVKMIGAIQQWVDHSISVTFNLKADITEEEISALAMQAWKLGCKGITVYRDGSLEGMFSTSSTPSVSNPIPSITERRPQALECDVVRFQNNKDKWVAFVGLLDGHPYEIFTGLQDDEEGIVLPKSVTKGRIIKNTNRDGTHRYDFQFENKRGYKTTVEGLSEKFNKEYWNYAKLISGVLRYRMPLERVLKLVSSLQLGDENINTWKTGVERALKKYVRDSDTSGNVCPHCGQSSVVHQEGIAICSCCGLSSTE